MSVEVVSEITCYGYELGSTGAKELWGHDSHDHRILGRKVLVPSSSDLESLSKSVNELQKTTSSTISKLRGDLRGLLDAIDAINAKQGEFDAQSEENRKFKEKIKQEIVAQLSSGSQFHKSIMELIDTHVKRVQEEVVKIQKVGKDASGILEKVNEIFIAFQADSTSLRAQFEAAVDKCEQTQNDMAVLAKQKLKEIWEEHEHIKKLLASAEEKVTLFTKTTSEQLHNVEKRAVALDEGIKEQIRRWEATEKRMAQLEGEYVARLKETERRQAEKSRQQEQTILELQERIRCLEEGLNQHQGEQQEVSASFMSRLAWLFRGNRKAPSEEDLAESRSKGEQ